MPQASPSTDRLVPAGALLRLDPKTGQLTARRYLLVVQDGPQAGVQLAIEGTCVVGSSEGVGLRLSDGAVSRFHVELRARPDGVLIKDLGSTNGTLLAGARISECIVDGEASLKVGKTSLRITVAEENHGVSQPRTSFGEAVGAGPAMQRLFGVLERVARSDSPVLLEAETGTGKDVLARGLHGASNRARGPYLVLDCAALTASLVESDLFGHAAGAFTGASGARKGAFERADGGTLFLDEVGELPLPLQPKLLRALEAGTVRPVGGDLDLSVDVRVIAATHQSLESRVAAGTFREDLYYRLAVIPLKVPPLRERLEDLPVLVEHLLARLGQSGHPLPESFWRFAHAHRWPGNVRELHNALERALAGVDFGDASAAAAPARELPYKAAKEQLVDRFTRDYLQSLITRFDGRVSKMAAAAGISPFYVRQLLKKHGQTAREDE
ncbi:MAG: sigma 54-interacting transcriptional regulator [Archangiaceae bacterium]|nr:sigma 54-interacting transcriptional regulator [Archangiaceae bacterium]